VPATKGSCVIVTGGASGLGAAIVAVLEHKHRRPVVLDRHPPAGGVPFEEVNLVDTRATEDAVRRVAERMGGLSAVVTCAAMDTPSDFEAADGARWDDIVKANLLGTAAVVRAALPFLLEEKGHIVTVASTLGLRALPAATAYCASKFGVVGFTRALAMELGGRVGVTMLIPGGMRTKFFDDREEEFKPAQGQMLNDPAWVAKAVLFALDQPPGCEVREMVITPSVEPSWP
jgi:NAD(P)-dependent dehydrogenase (short-subunit alcohol dehydrogenase family)